MYGYDYDYEIQQEKKKKIIKWSIIIGVSVILLYIFISIIICFIAHTPLNNPGSGNARINDFDNFDITEYYPYLK